MKRQFQLWGSRTFVVVLLVVGVQQWGIPLYKQYFTKKKVEVFVPTTKVRQGKFIVSFHEIGTLEAERSVPINSPIGGKIISLIPEGRTVTAGEQLVVLDTTDLEREVRSKQLAYDNALADVKREETKLEILKESNKTEMDQAQAELDYNKAELERAQKELEKQTDLANQKLVTRYRVDEAALKVESQKLSVKKGTMALSLKAKKVLSDEEQQMAEVRNKQNAANIAKIELEDVKSRVNHAIVRAPASGLVVLKKTWTGGERRKLKEGDSTFPGQTICDIPDLSDMQVIVQVGESDAPRIKVGLPVLIRLEAVRNKIFHGTVEEISSLATEGSPWDSNTTPGRKNFEVIIKVKESDPKTLKPGMTADVEFIIDTLNESVYVPIESVIEKGSKTYVFVKNGKKFIRTEVQTGINNDNFICIKKGLRGGEIIALRDPTRPLDEQEAGSAAPQAKKENQKKAAPIPGAE